MLKQVQHDKTHRLYYTSNMLNRLKIYTVHLKPDESDEIERLRFVSEGFNLYAFIFHIFWALYHRMWRFAGILIGINAVLVALLWSFGEFGPPTQNICQIGIQLWVGFVANDFLRAKLKRDGFITYALVSGENELRAEQRFFDQNVGQLSS
jgi:hypothetical protein